MCACFMHINVSYREVHRNKMTKSDIRTRSCILFIYVYTSTPNQNIFRMWMDMLILKKDPFSEESKAPCKYYAT